MNPSLFAEPFEFVGKASDATSTLPRHVKNLSSSGHRESAELLPHQDQVFSFETSTTPLAAYRISSQLSARPVIVKEK